MDDGALDRRESKRFACRDLVTLEMTDGEYKGACLVGLVINFSVSGACLVLDGGSFPVGTTLRVEFQDGLTLDGRIRRCTQKNGVSELGISFDAGDAALTEANEIAPGYAEV